MPGSRVKTALKLIVISVLGLIIGITISFYIVLRVSVPVTSGQIRLTGIQHPIEITFDSMGICQIWAETETDACFALGCQHAADRMFQMDLSRRLAGGRLSEMLGSITRDIDISQRRIGHNRLALKALETLSDENRNRLQAYADGVNAYKNHCRALPFEYRFLPVKFDDWTVLDCLTLLSFQTWFSNALMDRDEFYMNLAEKVGPDKARTLVIPYPYWAPTTVPETDLTSSDPHPSTFDITEPFRPSSIGRPKLCEEGPVRSIYHPFQRALAENFFGDNPASMRMTHSSNAWTVSPQKSVSGAAMLASDPHLELTRLPQFWYATGLHVRQDSIDIVGITTPGLPFFVMGHNGRAAWAFTAGGVDVTDYYLEEINPVDSNQYLTADGWRDFDIVRDSVYISDLDSFVHVTFRHTISGPITTEPGHRTSVYSFYWAGFDADINTAVGSGFGLHRIGTFEEFQQAVTRFGALDANMLYADINGNIGYQLTTPLPAAYDSETPLAASGRYIRHTREPVPIERTPYAFNPAQGWLASCNNLSRRMPPVRGHFFTSRIMSISHLLEGSDRFSTDDMRQFQMDKRERYLLRFKDQFARAFDAAGHADVANTMRAWDGLMLSDSKEATLVHLFLSRLKRLTFKDELDDLYYQIPSNWIETFEAVAEAGWFDNVTTAYVIETFDDIAVAAAKEAVADANGVVWGDIHSLSMAHPMAQIPVLSGLLGLSRGPQRWSGSAGTLCASFTRETRDGRYELMAGPSWRFVIDFADIDAATMVLPAGNSGNPMSKHFFDFYDMWESGRQWTVPFHYEKVKANAASILRLVPDTE